MGAMLRAGDRLTLHRILSAVRQERGNAVRAAKRLEVPVRTFQCWRKQVPALEQGIADIRDQTPPEESETQGPATKPSAVSIPGGP